MIENAEEDIFVQDDAYEVRHASSVVHIIFNSFT